MKSLRVICNRAETPDCPLSKCPHAVPHVACQWCRKPFRCSPRAGVVLDVRCEPVKEAES